MRNLGIIHILLFLLMMIVYQCSSAQDYLVTIKGDTLYGTIKPIFGADKKVQVVKSDKTKSTTPIFQVSMYLQKGEIYKPVKGPTGYTFMKLLKAGYLSLYAFQMENQTTFDGRFLLKRDGQSLEVPNLNFRKLLKNYLSDCAEVSVRVEQGDFAKKDLEKIIDEYNACIQNRTITQQKVIAENTENAKKVTAWEVLEEKVKTQPEFDGKNNALEMITEIKGKISKSEKVPNFLLDGLKSTLQQPDLQEPLKNALAEIH